MSKGFFVSVRPLLPHEGVGPPAAGLGPIRWSSPGAWCDRVGSAGVHQLLKSSHLTPPQTPQGSLHPADAPGRSPARRPYTCVDHQAGEAVAVDEHDLFVLVFRSAIGGFTAEGRRGEEHTLGGSMAPHAP